MDENTLLIELILFFH